MLILAIIKKGYNVIVLFVKKTVYKTSSLVYILVTFSVRQSMVWPVLKENYCRRIVFVHF